MNLRYEVRFAGSAEKDLDAIIEYIAADSPSNALEVLQKIRKKAFGLARYPQRGRIVPELREHGILLYRELIISPWRVIYRPAERIVYILAVLDSRRNIEDLLLQRLTNTKL